MVHFSTLFSSSSGSSRALAIFLNLWGNVFLSMQPFEAPRLVFHMVRPCSMIRNCASLYRNADVSK